MAVGEGLTMKSNNPESELGNDREEGGTTDIHSVFCLKLKVQRGSLASGIAATNQGCR